jgi:hypothetical protein
LAHFQDDYGLKGDEDDDEEDEYDDDADLDAEMVDDSGSEE